MYLYGYFYVAYEDDADDESIVFAGDDMIMWSNGGASLNLKKKYWY